MKYMGSKARLVGDILPIILKDRKPEQWYIEPFGGGMNSICHVTGNRIANDVQYYLIEMWKALIEGWIPVKITKEYYYDVRENKVNFPAYLVGWVGFNCSYSGKWFSGFAGDTKTKTGTVRDYQTEAIKNVQKQVGGLKGVVFTNKSYNDLDIPPNSIVYCDPPYANTTKYSVEFNHTVFWDWIRGISEAGHQVFVSEYSAPDDFECLYTKEVKSSLSANGTVGGSKSSTEKLFKFKG